MEGVVERAKERGFVETIFGRKRFLSEIASSNVHVRGLAERNAINAPIQGGAADLIKIAMIKIYKRLKKENYRSKMILQVHDELIFEVEPTEFDSLKDMVIYEMSNAARLSVPLVVDWGSGTNWLEAH
jgi:DNA polymerase-1